MRKNPFKLEQKPSEGRVKDPKGSRKPVKKRRRIYVRRNATKKGEAYLLSPQGRYLLKILQEGILEVEALKAGLAKLIDGLDVGEAVLAYHPNAWPARLPGTNKLSVRAQAIHAQAGKLSEACSLVDEKLNEICQGKALQGR